MNGWIIEVPPMRIITPTIPEMLILFFGFAVIIAIMYILYKKIKNVVEESEEKLSNAKIFTLDLLVITIITISLLLLAYEHMGFSRIICEEMLIPLIVSIILLIPIHINSVEKTIKTILKCIVTPVITIEYFCFSFLIYVDMIFHGGTYTSYSIYALTTLALLGLLYVFFTIILGMKTAKGLTAMKVIMILSAILIVINIGFYFGYERFHPVSEVGNWKDGTYQKIYH